MSPSASKCGRRLRSEHTYAWVDVWRWMGGCIHDIARHYRTLLESGPSLRKSRLEDSGCRPALSKKDIE